MSNAINIKAFGAVGDGVTNDGPVFAAAIVFLKTQCFLGYGYGAGSADLIIPAGHYYLGTTTLDLFHTIRLRGESTGLTGGGSTVLRWAKGVTGIRTQAYNTTGPSGTRTPEAGNVAGSGSTIERLFLQGGYDGTEGDFHGIHLRAMATINDVFITGFSGDGVHAASAIGGGALEGNANLTRITNITVQSCRNGIYFDSADSNAGIVIGANVSANRQWGIYDSSFLGNSYLGCHAAQNIQGPYFSDDPNARNTFVGCYSEGDQPPSHILSPALVLGGLHGAGFTAGTTAQIIGEGRQTPFTTKGQASGRAVSQTFGGDLGMNLNATGDHPTGWQFPVWNEASKVWEVRHARLDSRIVMQFTTDLTQYLDEAGNRVPTGEMILPRGFWAIVPGGRYRKVNP